MIRGRDSVAHLILAMEPEMRELLSLREEVVRLRVAVNPAVPTLVDLMADTPIDVRQDLDGRWSAKIKVGEQYTGYGPCETAVEAFKASIRHLATRLAAEWDRRDEDE